MWLFNRHVLTSQWNLKKKYIFVLVVFIWIISINKWKQNNKWSQIHSLGSIVNSERSVLNTLFLSNSHQVTQYWHLQATTLHIFPLFTVNILAIMTIITHYQWIGSRDGGTQGVWSNAPQGISLVCVCVCVRWCVCCITQEWKGWDVISSHIDFPAHMLNWSCWGIHNWRWFSQSLSLSPFLKH